VERGEQDSAVEAPQVQEAFQLVVDRSRRRRAVARRWAEPVLRPAAQLLHVPRQPVLGDHAGDAVREPLRERDSHCEVLRA
jgi:hypothetical protein